MSSHEAPHFDASRRVEAIALSTDLDDDWCRMFTEVYREANYRTVLSTSYYFTRARPKLCTSKSKRLEYDKIEFEGGEFYEELVDGRVIGARNMPIKFETEEGAVWFGYMPHIVMIDTVILPQYGNGESIKLSEGPYEQLIIPLTTDSNNLNLYPAQN
jgi:hypothetical protein